MFHFNSNDKPMATAALIVYTIYRSRSRRFKVSKTMFDYISQNILICAKRSKNTAIFISKFCKKIKCDVIKTSLFEDESYTLSSVIDEANNERVIEILKTEHAMIMLLVRERLDYEKKQNEGKTK